MIQSPGHKKWPDHKVIETHVDERLQIEIGGQVVADSSDVIKVEEDNHPDRYYFPRSDVRMQQLERSKTTTECPFKGTAHYYNVRSDDERFDDAIWTYEEPYQEHQGLKERLAFDSEAVPAIHMTRRAA